MSQTKGQQELLPRKKEKIRALPSPGDLDEIIQFLMEAEKQDDRKIQPESIDIKFRRRRTMFQIDHPELSAEVFWIERELMQGKVLSIPSHRHKGTIEKLENVGFRKEAFENIVKG